MRAIVKTLPRLVDGSEADSAEFLAESAKEVQEGLREILDDLQVTADQGSWTLNIETSSNMLTGDVPHKVAEYFAQLGIRVEIPESKFEIVCA